MENRSLEIDRSFVKITNVKFMSHELIYRCSHDMSAPIKSIAGLLNLLEATTDRTQTRLYIHLIIVTLKKMDSLLQMIDQILINDESELVLKPVPIHNLMGRILSAFESALREKGIIVTVKIDQNETFCSDAKRIFFSLCHLISNAITFCDNDKGVKVLEIQISVYAKACVIRVKDNGIGMNKLVSAKVFQPFFRGSEKSKGSGLGLFVVDSIMRKLGGKISLTSNFSEGSVFTLWIPNATG